jgi:hypothetical protein
MKRLFGPKKEEVKEEGKRLHNWEPNINTVIIKKKMR